MPETNKRDREAAEATDANDKANGTENGAAQGAEGKLDVQASCFGQARVCSQITDTQLD